MVITLVAWQSSAATGYKYLTHRLVIRQTARRRDESDNELNDEHRNIAVSGLSSCHSRRRSKSGWRKRIFSDIFMNDIYHICPYGQRIKIVIKYIVLYII